MGPTHVRLLPSFPAAWRRSGRLPIFSFPRSFTSRSGKQDPNSIPSSVPSLRILHRRPLASSFLFVDDHGCRLSHSPSFFLLSDLAADLFSPRRHRSSPCFFPYSLPTELLPPTTVAGSVVPLPQQCPRRLPLLHRPVSIPSPPTKLAVLIPHPRSSLPSTAGDSQNLSLFLPTSAATHVFLLSFFAAVADAVHRLFLLLLPPLPSSPPSIPSSLPLTAVASALQPPCPPPPPLPRTVAISLPPPSRPPPLELVVGTGRWDEDGASPSWLIEWTGGYWIWRKSSCTARGFGFRTRSYAWNI